MQYNHRAEIYFLPYQYDYCLNDHSASTGGNNRSHPRSVLHVSDLTPWWKGFSGSQQNLRKNYLSIHG